MNLHRQSFIEVSDKILDKIPDEIADKILIRY